MTEICQYLHNYFDRNQGKFYGLFEIHDNTIESVNDGDMGLIEGQYFRIIGSRLNDGVYCLDDNLELKDESFDGCVWSMAVPPEVIRIAEEITSWKSKYGELAVSPYSSESFGGYSYSKANASSEGNPSSWQSVFASQLSPWRKL